MGVKLNLSAGIASSIWTAVITLAVTPLYIHYLGIESYGLIGIFLTLQGLCQLLDFGLAPTINREVAQGMARDELKPAQSLLHSMAAVYWLIALGIVGIVFLCAPLLAEHWISSDQYDEIELTSLISLMGIAVAARWPTGLYQGAAIGANALGAASIINIVMLSIANLGAVAAFEIFSPTLQTFLTWQMGAGFSHALLMRWLAWSRIGRASDLKVSLSELRRTLSFSAGMTGIAVSSIILTQLDKVLLSKILDLEFFGYYMLAHMVSRVLYIFVTPLFNIVYPTFSALSVTSNKQEAMSVFRLSSSFTAIVLFPLAMLFVFFGTEILTLWLGDHVAASEVALLTSILVLGSSLHGLMYVPYALQLGFGQVWLPLTINIAFIVLMVPLITALAILYGAAGGAAAWLIMEIIYFFVGTALTQKYLLACPRWGVLFRDLTPPLVLSVLIVGGGSALIDSNQTALISVIFGAALLFISCVLSATASAPMKSKLAELLAQARA